MLPNGKVNYKALKAMADKEASQAQETVMDSLGQMKSMSRAAILENAVIHRCYAFWMLGVLTDHYAWCAMSTDPKARSSTTRHLMMLGLHRSHACSSMYIHVHEAIMEGPHWDAVPALLHSLGLVERRPVGGGARALPWQRPGTGERLFWCPSSMFM